MLGDLPSDDGVSVAAACGNLLGEGPIWVAREQALYWVDILEPAIWRLTPKDHDLDHWTPPTRVTSIVPRAKGGLVGAGDTGFLTLCLTDDRYESFGHPEQGLSGNRFNDGGVDGQGGYWVGSMHEGETAVSGHVYRIAPDRSWQTIDSGFRVPNGPAFSPDGQSAYLADSALGVIYRYTLEHDGSAPRRAVFLEVPAEQGCPDGMATDANGCLWIAFWDGGCVRCLNPDGTVLREIRLPVSRPTSCAFGGEELDALFVTSARTGLTAAQLAAEPLAGALFQVSAGVHGWPLPDFDG